MANAKENKSNKTMMKVGDAYGLQQAISNLASSVPSMKGKVVYALTKNENKIESVLKANDKKQKAIIDKYVKFKKDGSFDLTEPTQEEIEKGAQQEYKYKSEKGKEDAKKEMEDLMAKEVEFEFHKIWKNDFDAIDIPTARNPRIGVLIEHLVTDVADLQLMN